MPTRTSPQTTSAGAETRSNVPTPRATRTETPRFDVAGKHVCMLGIGGCGVSGLARMFKARGAIVTGTDKEESDVTRALNAEGIDVGFDQQSGLLPERCDMVVASAAIPADHPQAMTAVGRGIPMLLYAEALGQCMLGRTGIAVAGTHGKSTTTAMLGAALVDAGLDPSVIVGATCRQLVRGSLGSKPGDAQAGFRLGSATIPRGSRASEPGLLVAEACEFNRSFHNFHPAIASISSVEADHLDVYGTLDAVVESFHEFAKLLPPAAQGGRLLIAHTGAHRREVTAGLDCAIETIGYSPEADWAVAFEPRTRRITLTHAGEEVAAWCNTLPGAHNAMNAAFAFVLATYAGAEAEVLARSLAAFGGVDRRMQLLGERDAGPGAKVRVYDDYGHHPTEVDSTLRALREAERPEERGGRLICVFQPHQHSRTRHLLDEFANSFGHADVVIVPHIYFVRDSQEEKHKVGASDLVDRLRGKGKRAMHLYPFEAIVEQLENLCRPGDVVVVMGAGPVWRVGTGYLEQGEDHGGC